MPLDPASPYRIVLSRKDLETVLQALGQQPYAVAAGLIGNLLEQAHQIEKAAASAVEGPQDV